MSDKKPQIKLLHRHQMCLEIRNPAKMINQWQVLHFLRKRKIKEKVNNNK